VAKIHLQPFFSATAYSYVEAFLGPGLFVKIEADNKIILQVVSLHLYYADCSYKFIWALL